MSVLRIGEGSLIYPPPAANLWGHQHPWEGKKTFLRPCTFCTLLQENGNPSKKILQVDGTGWYLLQTMFVFFLDELPSFLATSFCHREEWKDCWLLNVFRLPWKVFAITNTYQENKIKFTLQGEPPWDSHSMFCSASYPVRLLSLYTAEEFAKRRVLVDIRDTLKNGAKKELCLLEES